MSDSEFVMTYPCFFVVNEHGAPDIVQIDDALCVCLFTDSDAVQGFHQDKYGTTDAGPKAFVMKSPADLIYMLREWQPCSSTTALGSSPSTSLRRRTRCMRHTSI